MDFWQVILMPFSWLLKTFCQVFNSYGVALLLFTLVVKVILFPLSLKGKKSCGGSLGKMLRSAGKALENLSGLVGM